MGGIEGVSLTVRKEVVVTPVPPEPQTIEMWMWETEPRWMNVEATSDLNDKFPHVEFKWTALPVALATIMGGGSHELPYDLLLAGSLLAVLPPLLMLVSAQRFKSLVASAFK